MADFIITTDNTADLPARYLEQHQIPYVKLSYILDDQVYEGEADFDSGAFYDKIRAGSMPTTSQVSIEEAKLFFEQYLNDGLDILHIAFSSALSGSYNNCCIAAQELMELYPEQSIVVIDSLSASLGEGLLVHQAVRLRDENKSMNEIADYLEQHKKNICHLFTVDDLNHLFRGGRVSRFEAMAGSLIGIKPILHVDDEGRLIPVGKVRGRKMSLKSLVERMKQQIGSHDNPVIFISHGDCLQDAEYVKQLVEEQFGIHSFLINPVGPVIGTHSGPGTIALFFIGDSR